MHRMQLNYNVLVFIHCYAMAVFQLHNDSNLSPYLVINATKILHKMRLWSEKSLSHTCQHLGTY